MPKTLLEISGVQIKHDLPKSVLLLIDYQNEYLDGSLPLDRIGEAVEETRKLLEIARNAKIPVIHVIHRGNKGELFDLDGSGGKVIRGLEPEKGEYVVEKTFPNSFTATELEALLKKTANAQNLLIAGLMTHMCLSSTVRSASDHGYKTTVVAATTTTRDLSGLNGKIIKAQDVKDAALASLKDRFALILDNPEDLLGREI